MPYAVIASRSYPSTKYEYAFATLEESEAMVSVDHRLIKTSSGVRDYCIISEHDKKLLARFDEAELGSLFRQWYRDQEPPTEYQKLLQKVAEKIGNLSCGTVPLHVLDEYRRQQAANKSKLSQSKLENIMTAETTAQAETTVAGKQSTKKKASAKKAPAKKAAAKSAKGKTAAKTATKGVKAKTAAKKTSAPRDPLGREGTVARFMSERIMAGEPNDKISAAATKKFPESKSTESKHVSWQRFNLGRKGVKVPAVKE